MKDVGEEKIGESDEELEIESEEKARGEKIEIDEDRLPSRAMAIHEHIRQDGEKEMERDAMALFWSAIAAGLSMGASLLAKGIFHVQLEGVPGGFLLENLGYTFGFVIVIMARQQLVYRKHGDRRSAGDAKPYPRQFRFIDASVERRPAG